MISSLGFADHILDKSANTDQALSRTHGNGCRSVWSVEPAAPVGEANLVARVVEVEVVANSVVV